MGLPRGLGPDPLAPSIRDMDLTATFTVDDVSYTGSVQSMADCSVAVAFGVQSVRALALPSKIQMTLSGGPLKEDLSASGNVRQWFSEGEEECLRIDIRDDQFAVLESAAFPKRASRTEVRGSKAIRVSLTSLEGEAKASAAMVDISDSGVAVILTCADDLLLAQDSASLPAGKPWKLRLALQLPGNESELKFVGEIRYRMFTRKCIKYGVRFDNEATEATFPDEQLGIQGHIDRFRKTLNQAA